MIRLEIGLEIRHREVMSLCAIEDKTAVVVVQEILGFYSEPLCSLIVKEVQLLYHSISHWFQIDD